VISFTVVFDAASRQHNYVVLTSFSVYLFTLPVNLFQSIRKIMGFSDKDKILIKNLHKSKGYRGYSAKKTNEFPVKSWSKRGVLAASYTRDKERLSVLKEELVNWHC